MVLPIVKAFTDKAAKKEIEIALIILFLFNLFIQTLNNISPIIGFYLPIKTNAIFYLILGKYLDEKLPEVVIKNQKKLLLVFVIIAITISVILPSKANVLLGYSSPIIAIIAICIYSCVRRFETNRNIWNIDRLCFAVYLVHPVFTNAAYKFIRVTPLIFGKAVVVGILVFWMIFAFCGFTCAWILSRISILRKYVI